MTIDFGGTIKRGYGFSKSNNSDRITQLYR